MLSLAENPPILLPEVESLTELRGLWWLAYTRPRFEKVFAWDLYNHGIGYFLPMYEKTIFSGGRNRRLMMPLFTSYVFFCGTEQDRYAAMRTNRLCHTVDVADQQRLIDELASIEAALLSKAVIAGYPGLGVGSRCRVTSGPMKDIEGVIVERKCPRARMVIEVSILTQGALVEIDADLLEPL
jgi:transcription antitermination factor NusG